MTIQIPSSRPLTAQAASYLAATPLPPLPTPRRRRRWPSFTKVILPLALFAFIVLFVVIVPLLPSYDPYSQNLSEGLLPAFKSSHHLLGTDQLGRDTLSRLAIAGRVSLLIAVAVVAINAVLGITLGLIAGYFGGFADTVIMGLADIQLAVPVLLLLLAIVSAHGSSLTILVIVLGVTFWVGYGRMARAVALSLRDREFVLAPVTQGAGSAWILRKHLLPNVIPQMAIMAAFDVGLVVTIEAALDFLGLGVQPPTPSWGAMIADGQSYLQSDPVLCLAPGVAMFLLISSVQFFSRNLTTEGSVDGVAEGVR
jgi:peptide/nickel transport system permease protein